MFDSFLSSLRAGAKTDLTRRRHPRREADRCVVAIEGKTYPVENWSFGGVLITSDDRVFADGQDLPLTLKFKLRNAILDVKLSSRIVRKGNHRIALRFEHVGRSILRSFQQVIDDAIARDFAKSQV